MVGRRGFLSALFGAGASLTALQRLVPEAEISEIQREQRYLFKFNCHLTQAHVDTIADKLREVGVKGIVCDSNCEVSKL